MSKLQEKIVSNQGRICRVSFSINTLRTGSHRQVVYSCETTTIITACNVLEGWSPKDRARAKSGDVIANFRILTIISSTRVASKMHLGQSNSAKFSAMKSAMKVISSNSKEAAKN